MRTYLVHGGRWLALALALVIAQTLGGMLAHGLLADAVSAAFLNTKVDWPGIITVAALEAGAVYCLLTGLAVERRHQVWILFAFYWGTKFFQMLIEAAFYLNVWLEGPLMSWPELGFSGVYGTVTGLLFAPLVVWIANVKPAATREPVLLPPFVPALKAGAVYVPVYFSGRHADRPTAGRSRFRRNLWDS